MTKPVWILDTTWDPNDLEQRNEQFPFLNVLRSKEEITKRISALTKSGTTDEGDFYFVHQSDVLEQAHLLDGLLGTGDFVLFSGASAGADDRLHPRNKIKKNLNDFLQYWKKDDAASAKALLSETKPVREIDRIRLWIDRAQHDYINLLAPLDVLALAYVGGEIDETTYTQTRKVLTERLKNKAENFINQQASNLRGLARVFDEAITLFEDPHEFKRPAPLVPSFRS